MTFLQTRPFSFSTYGQGFSVGPRGVGFPTFPDGGQRFFMIGGRAGYNTRNFFVWLITYLLKYERRNQGFFPLIWPGQRRVSWQQANGAMQRLRQAQSAQV